MVTINIEKRHLIVFCVVIGIVAGMLVAYAYNNPPGAGVPSNFGHSIDEIDWSQTIPNIKVMDIVMGRGNYNDDAQPYEFVRLNSSQGSFGALIHSRTGVLGDDNFIIYSYDKDIVLEPGNRNVGIGQANPTAKLDVNGRIRGTELCISNNCRTEWLPYQEFTYSTNNNPLDTNLPATDWVCVLTAINNGGCDAGYRSNVYVLGNGNWGVESYSYGDCDYTGYTKATCFRR